MGNAPALPLLLAALLVVPVAAAAGPGARADLTAGADITALDVGRQWPGFLWGSLDPGSTTSGEANAPVYAFYDDDGRRIATASADYRNGSTTCAQRFLDDCKTPVAGVAVDGVGDYYLVASILTDTPLDSHRGQLVLGHIDRGLVDRLHTTGIPVAVALSDDGSAAALLERIPSLMGNPTGRITFYTLSDTDDRLTVHRAVALEGNPKAMAVSHDGAEAIVAADTILRIAREAGAPRPHGGAAAAPTVAAVSNVDPYWAVTGHPDGEVVLTRADQSSVALVRKPGAAIHSVAMAPDGLTYAAGDADGKLHVYVRTPGAGSAATLAATFDAGSVPVAALAWSDDATYLVAAAGDKARLLRWGGTTLTPLWTDTLPAAVTHVAVSATSDVIAVAAGTTLRLYDAQRTFTAVAAGAAGLPGDQPQLKVTYTNTGNRPIELTLAADGPALWNPTLRASTVTVPVGGSAEARLSVRVPAAHAPGPVDFWVNHTTAGGATGSTKVQATVTAFTDLYLEVDGPDVAGVDAGGQATFKAELVNDGNAPGAATLTVETSSGWQATVSPREATVQPGERASVTVTVTAPTGARDGDQAIVTLGIEGDPVSDVLFAATVGARFGVRLLIPGGLSVDAGNTSTFQVQVENTGNTPDSYLLRIDQSRVPPGWGATFAGGLAETELRLVAPGTKQSVPVVVTVPADAPDQGVLVVAIGAQSLGSNAASDTRQFLVTVGAPATNTKESPGAGVFLVGVLAGLAATVARRRGQPIA